VDKRLVIKNAFSIINSQLFIVLWWRLLEFLSLKRVILLILRAQQLIEISNNKAEINKSIHIPNFGSLFKNKYSEINAEGQWVFNGKVIELDEAFIYGRINKDNYTDQMVFLYLDWAFNLEDGSVFFKNMLTKISLSENYWHPLPSSIRVYPLLFNWSLNKSDFIIDHLKESAQFLLINTEEHVGGNHLLDNYIAMLVYSIVLGLNSSIKLFSKKLILKLSTYEKLGYFPEKNPVYEELLYKRLFFLKKIVRLNRGNIPLKGGVLEQLELLLENCDKVFLNHPSVTINDSYLECYSRKDSIKKHVKNYFLESSFYGVKTTFVFNSIPNRGFMGHAHDACGSLFVEIGRKKIITSFGTSKYANSLKRNVSRSIQSYPTFNYTDSLCHMSHNGSFRVVRFSRPRVVHDIDSDWYQFSQKSLEINSKVRRFDIKFFDDNILVSSLGRDMVFSFYSDFKWSNNEKKLECEYISIHPVKSFSIKKTFRFNGIYNKTHCYKCKVIFNGLLSIEIKGVG
jgi:hypothetical protein